MWDIVVAVNFFDFSRARVMSDDAGLVVTADGIVTGAVGSGAGVAASTFGFLV